jgi:pyridoxine 5-phosphate synthase
MLKLGVNIDHVATLREARYRGRDNGVPDPIEAAKLCLEAGAHGITAHLREDRRHIQDRDVWRLRELVKTRFNLEMAMADEIIQIVLKVKPDIVCIVPEKRQEVTTEGGLNVVGQFERVREVVKRLNDAGIDVSLFINPEIDQIEAAARTGCQFVELHTGAYSEVFSAEQTSNDELEKLARAACLANSLGLKVNAGHGLNYMNLPLLLANVPFLQELNIGHAIISRAVFTGIKEAVSKMLEIMVTYRVQNGFPENFKK